ncbi:translation initiation factor IF-2-like isoform X1 [Canis lupus familiaris]|uniref:translation initiation factor IF-2-like isoform X1 n=1 Tax=Canis lupus familiaris TaxID=9615 RepID=UPI0018F3F569|nr:translation initiation factor IF-2-like isoform X1 [Canis lupus familiaris]XP_038391382.1 translation initiation factor IF-2-like isoform X1 [Canis lupus familiaris]XP_038518303.1 translation initiation factor IF-2-like isoform X1 [Canis lupus familiaris]
MAGAREPGGEVARGGSGSARLRSSAPRAARGGSTRNRAGGRGPRPRPVGSPGPPPSPPRPAREPQDALPGPGPRPPRPPRPRPGSTCRSPAAPGDPLIGCGRSPAPPVAAGHSGNCSPPRARGHGWASGPLRASLGRTARLREAGRAAWPSEEPWGSEREAKGLRERPLIVAQRLRRWRAPTSESAPQLPASLPGGRPLLWWRPPVGEGPRPHLRGGIGGGFPGVVLPPSARNAAPLAAALSPRWPGLPGSFPASQGLSPAAIHRPASKRALGERTPWDFLITCFKMDLKIDLHSYISK